MNKEQIEIILARVKFNVPGMPTHRFDVITHDDYNVIRVAYVEPDVETSKIEEQHSRKWEISQWATETEVVETAFLCLERSILHRLKEWFTYKGAQVYSPHFDINDRVELAKAKKFDKRA